MKYSGILGLNSIMRPKGKVSDFINLAKTAGFAAVELRNDLPDTRVYGCESAEEIRNAAKAAGVKIITLNALQRFNDPALFSEKVIEIEELAKIAADINCGMLVLCPVNDANDNRSPEQQHENLAQALKLYEPILNAYNITGLIEPLGFSICSIRTKAQAVKAIKETGLSACYKITHDTFHHYLAGEDKVFPAETGLVHVSGVLPGKDKVDITDDDRILVTSKDCMGNREQVKALIDGGYTGPVSYEAFSPEVQEMSYRKLINGIKESVQLLFS